jgi:hypothetical protein
MIDAYAYSVPLISASGTFVHDCQSGQQARRSMPQMITDARSEMPA